MYFLSILSCFKNESHILQEWLQHYLNQGVDHFFLINNGSTDDFRSTLQPFLDRLQVTLIEDAQKHAQEILLNRYGLSLKSATQWLLLVDLDEFVYARGGYSTIPQFLIQLEKKDPLASQVFIPWKMFGSNGFKTQPSSVRQSFVLRQDYDFLERTQAQGMNERGKILGKTIVNMRFIRRLGVHHSRMRYQGHDYSSSFQRTIPTNFQPINEAILKENCLHLNHYAIQSWEYFSKVKMKRGDVLNVDNETIRNEQYFQSYDTKHLMDNELAQLTDNVIVEEIVKCL